MLRLLSGFVLLLLLAACSSSGGRFSSSHASGTYLAEPMQCVPYARQASGVKIFGNANTWWQQAAGRYARGALPQPGAVLVLASTQRMRYGHVAVVKRLVSSREIDVAHSNWGSDFDTRRMAYESMRVQDISSRNDWSKVRFWNFHLGQYGLPYAVQGFIYPY
jgi:surface antigen